VILDNSIHAGAVTDSRTFSSKHSSALCRGTTHIKFRIMQITANADSKQRWRLRGKVTD